MEYLIEDIAENNQVILFMSKYDLPINACQINTLIDLDKVARSSDSLIYYKYGFIEEIRNSNSLMNNRLKDKRFIINQIINVEEDYLNEFKEVKGTNPISSILSIVDQYVVAFLNSTEHGTGRIYWGIKDEDRTVVGVNLNLKERDKLRRVISEKLFKIKPTIASSSFKIKLDQVYDKNGSEIFNLYVVIVSVQTQKSDYLFCTGRDEVYIKTSGGKKKLNSLEMQKEFQNRISKKL